MNFAGNSRYLKVVVFTVCFSVTILSAPAYSEVKGIQVEDKRGYSRIIIYLTAPASYKTDTRGGKTFILKIDDGRPDSPLPVTRYSSRYIKELETYKGEDGRRHLRISLFNRLAKVSDFFLKSPPRIEVNINAEVAKNVKGETRQLVQIISQRNPKANSKTNHKIKSRQPNKKPAIALSVKKTNAPLTVNQFEGIEDLIGPQVNRFVEIFDTETPLSVYHIILPSLEKINTSPDSSKQTGKYKLKDRLLKKVFEYVDGGGYKGALQLLKKASPEVKKYEEYKFLKADAVFQKSLLEGGISDAIDQYSNLILRYPDSEYIPWALMQIGRGRLSLKSYKGAAETFESIVNKFTKGPYEEEARLSLARSLFGKGEKVKALSLYKEFIENNPSSPWLAKAVFGAAQTLGHLGRHKKAGILFEKALKLWPDYPARDPENLMMIAESFYHLKRFDIAAGYFNELVNIYPDYRQSDRAMGRQGDIYFQMGNIKSAKQIYKETASKYPGSDGALIGMIRMADIMASEGATIGRSMYLYRQVYEKYTENLLAEVSMLKAGLFLMKRKKYAEAFDLFESFLSIYPKSGLKNTVYSKIIKTFSLLLEEKYKAGNCLELIRMAQNNEKLLGALEEKNTIFKRLAVCHLKYGQYMKAAQNYELISKGPHLEEARFNIGKAAYMTGDMKNAEKLMTAFRERFPRSDRMKETSYILAKSNESLGNRDKAIAFYKEYIKKEKDKKLRAEALIDLAGRLREGGLTMDAVKAYRQGIKIYPAGNSERLAVVYFSLAEVLFSDAKFNEALAAFKMVKKDLSPGLYQQAAYKRALCLDRLGKKDRAQKTFGKVRDVDGAAFWNDLSSAKLEDMSWQENHD